jgi:hypothetical protein
MKRVLTLVFAVSIILGVSASNSYSTPTGFNTLLEFCTGTWCGYCPCGDITADALLVNFPNTMILAYHGGGGGDPYQVFNGNSIISMMGFAGYPTGFIGRRRGPFEYPGWNNPVVQQNSSVQPGVSIVITKNYNTGTRQLDVTATCTALMDITTDCNINFIVTEDGLVFNQVNYGTCVGGGPNWVHKWVVRNMVTNATGESISTGTWTNGTVIIKNWTTTIDAAWIPANCNINVFVALNASPMGTAGSVQQTNKWPVVGLTGINNQNTIPANFSLSQNYPNPFNPTTNIHFSLPKDGNASLKIYDILGNEVATYVDGFIKAGTYNAEVDASNWASGIYFYTLRSGSFVETKKLSLIK